MAEGWLDQNWENLEKMKTFRYIYWFTVEFIHVSFSAELLLILASFAPTDFGIRWGLTCMHNIVQESIKGETAKKVWNGICHFAQHFRSSRHTSKLKHSEIFVKRELHWSTIKQVMAKAPNCYDTISILSMSELQRRARERGTCPSFKECQFHCAWFSRITLEIHKA